MKFIFVIKLSEDGLYTKSFTNVKALYKGITDTEYQPEIIDSYNTDNVEPKQKFTYVNLLKEIRLNQAHNRFSVCYIHCNNFSSTIEVMELSVNRK